MVSGLKVEPWGYTCLPEPMHSSLSLFWLLSQAPRPLPLPRPLPHIPVSGVWLASWAGSEWQLTNLLVALITISFSLLPHSSSLGGVLLTPHGQSSASSVTGLSLDPSSPVHFQVPVGEAQPYPFSSSDAARPKQSGLPGKGPPRELVTVRGCCTPIFSSPARSGGSDGRNWLTESSENLVESASASCSLVPGGKMHKLNGVSSDVSRGL